MTDRFTMPVSSLRDKTFARGPVTEWEAWARLNARAATDGSFMCSLRDLQAEFMWRSDYRVRTFLDKLEAEGLIERKSHAKNTQITICQQTGNRKPQRTENAKNTQRGTRLPADWYLPKAWGEWALEQGMDVETIRAEADKFRDHWHSQSGQRGVKADWEATWRNWCRKAMENRSRGRRGNGENRTSRFMRLADRFDGEPEADNEMAGDAGAGAPIPLFSTRSVG